MKCLKKIEGCNDPICGNEIIECGKGSMCHALINILNKNKTNTTDMIESIDYDIDSAGCWSGNDECLRPIDFVSKFNSSSYIHGDPDNAFQVYHDRNYTIPTNLLKPLYQNSCIVYSADSHDHIFMKKYNKRYCCCTTELCNQNIIFTLEKNPYVSAFDTSHFKQVISTKKSHFNSHDIYHYNELTIGLSLILIILIIAVMYKFRHKIRKNITIFYNKSQNGRRNSSTIDETIVNYNTNSDNIVMNENSSVKIQQSQAKQAIINEYLNNNTIPNNLTLQQSQPLLFSGAKGAMIPSSVVAPNANMLPSDLFRAKDSINMNPNSNLLPKYNQSNVIHSLPTTNDGLNELIEIHDNFKEDTQSPKNLQPSDLDLITKVASGQFSSVWKAKCKSSQLLDDKQEPLYAIKIFSNLNKSAWQNEKEIYICLHTTHENILKYYGAYAHVADKNDKNDQNIFMFNLNLNEYWLIIEYHEIGSLYDFLKANFITYPQMINLCHSILEGLSYLHSENLDSKKTFAIAHRDLKSKNILVKNDRNTCCIGDFGLALKLNNSNKLNSAEIRSKVGTRRYMSPELIEGAIVFTKETFLRIDVYAIALTLWEILSRGNFYEEKSDYKMPFEPEVGPNPSLEEMKEIVVDKCIRPTIQSNWLNYYEISKLVQTIEECWDIDLDARISSTLAATRIKNIKNNIILNN